MLTFYGADMKGLILALTGVRGTMTLVPIDDLRKRLELRIV